MFIQKIRKNPKILEFVTSFLLIKTYSVCECFELIFANADFYLPQQNLKTPCSSLTSNKYT